MANVDMAGNVLHVEDIRVGATRPGEEGAPIDISGAVFNPDNVTTPGDKASTPDGFDNVISVDIGGTPYYIGLYTDNDTA